MTKTPPRQLELPVMVSVTGNAAIAAPAGAPPAERGKGGSVPIVGIHRPASQLDQSIYKAISDNYFQAVSKRSG